MKGRTPRGGPSFLLLRMPQASPGPRSSAPMLPGLACRSVIPPLPGRAQSPMGPSGNPRCRGILPGRTREGYQDRSAQAE